jgi:hypothetical protein
MGLLVLFALMLPFFSMPGHGIGLFRGVDRGPDWLLRILSTCWRDVVVRSLGGLAGIWERLEAGYRTPIRSFSAVSQAKGRVDHTQSYCRFRACHSLLRLDDRCD